MNAIGYVRVSTEEQARSGVSLEAQHQSLTAYATLRGLDLVETIEDPGISAGKPLETRPGGRRLLIATRRRKSPIKAVVAWRLDRLFRSAIDCLRSVEQWDKAGIALHLVSMGGASIDTSTASGKLFLTMLAGMAEHERMVISERTKEAMRHMRETGQKISSDPPYGFRFEGKAVVPDHDEQLVVAQVLDLHRDGNTYRGIADALNESEIPARGERWHHTTVFRLVRRERARETTRRAEK